MSFRKEKKFRLTNSDLSMLFNALSKKGMISLYPERMINSCYFDTQNMDLFSDSEEGVLPRKKIRVRWYEKELNFNREIKISSIEGRFKTTSLETNIQSLSDVVMSNYHDQMYGPLKPSLLVSYRRQYFTLNNLRLTFDTKISYSKPLLFEKVKIQDSECVMEIKVPFDCDDDYIEKYIPHSTARFSKYSRGLLYLSGQLT